jgi:hypothetical protein
MEDQQLFEAIENIRRDKHEPWRYLGFTLLNGIAQGLGMALGATIVLALVIYLVTIVLTQMIDFPIVGAYVTELMKLLDTSVKHSHGARVR